MAVERKRLPSHPGEYIQLWVLDPNEVTVSKAAQLLGVSRQTLSRVINGRGPVTADLALKLERVFGVEAGTTLRMQTAYDEAMARKEAKSLLKGLRRFKPKSSHRIAQPA